MNSLTLSNPQPVAAQVARALKAVLAPQQARQPARREPPRPARSQQDAADLVDAIRAARGLPLVSWTDGITSKKLPMPDTAPVDYTTGLIALAQAAVNQPATLITASGNKASGSSLTLTLTGTSAREIWVPAICLEVSASDTVSPGDFTFSVAATSKSGVAYASGNYQMTLMGRTVEQIVAFNFENIDGKAYPLVNRLRTSYPVLPSGTTLPGNVTLTGNAVAPNETIVVTVSAAPDDMYFSATALTVSVDLYNEIFASLMAKGVS